MHGLRPRKVHPVDFFFGMSFGCEKRLDGLVHHRDERNDVFNIGFSGCLFAQLRPRADSLQRGSEDFLKFNA
jgi:hypothetical protein